jgi:hypothetical protein
MSYSDDDLARELRRELQGSLVPFDPAQAQYMIDESIAASPVRRVLRSRWTLPLLASGAVAAVVGGVAGAAALYPDGKPAHPGGGPTVTVRRSPLPTSVPPCRSTVPPTPPKKPVPPVQCTYTLPGTPTTAPVPPTVSPSGPGQPPTSVATTLPAATPSTASSAPPTATTLPPKKPVPPPSTLPSPTSLVPMPGRG